MKILLLRLRLIGDVMFTTPLIRALRRTYPDAHLAYLVEPIAAPVVVNNPHLDEMIVAPKRSGVRRVLDDLALARRLRVARFDLAIDLHGGPRSAWFAWASGARERIGYDIEGRRWMYTRVAHRSRDLLPRHSVLNQWDLLEAIPDWPGQSPTPGGDPVEMALEPSADARMSARLLEAGVGDTDHLIVVHVSAGNPFRRWPEASFVDLVVRLVAKDGRRRLVLSSGPSDRHAASRIAARARHELGGGAAGRIIELGEFDLQELRALIGRSRLFVGGDTGPLHIAAATATPIVGIFGPTLPARSAPWRPGEAHTISVELTDLPCRPCNQRVCTPGDFRCLTTLTPDSVLRAAERALAPL
ncbi:MAG TPA: glycosyltransferase family 9 protein [Vicinamibacterales bacterium]